jgi:hypothetical protein
MRIFRHRAAVVKPLPAARTFDRLIARLAVVYCYQLELTELNIMMIARNNLDNLPLALPDPDGPAGGRRLRSG